MQAALGDSCAPSFSEQVDAAKQDVLDAVTLLGDADTFGKQLTEWVLHISSRSYPHMPPKIGKRLSDSLKQRRQAARETGVVLRNLLHTSWKSDSAAADVVGKKEYDSARDWATERAERSFQTWKAEQDSVRRAREEAKEHARVARIEADEAILVRYSSLRASPVVRHSIAQRRQRQWASRYVQVSSSDSEHSDADESDGATGETEQRRSARTHRHRARKLAAFKAKSAEEQTNELLRECVESMLQSLEREARKAHIIMDGCTLYNTEFHRINPHTRKPAGYNWSGREAFVAYPDGSRCWVRPPFHRRMHLGMYPPQGLAGVTQPWLLVDSTFEHGFLPPAPIEGASPEEVTEVCVLLRSLSKVRGAGRLSITRCSEHDWCNEVRVPCSSDSPERVLTAVLSRHELWSISWLAKEWRVILHRQGIEQFTDAQGRLTSTIRPMPATVPSSEVSDLPSRSRVLSGPALEYHRQCSLGGANTFCPCPLVLSGGRRPDSCRESVRDITHGRLSRRVSIRCERRHCHPEKDFRPGVYYPSKDHFVCVCDATMDELQMIARIDDRAQVLSEQRHEEYWQKQREASECAARAAQTRRENKRKAAADVFDEEEAQELASLQQRD